MRTNYILIDFENVQPDIIPSCSDSSYKVLVFNGNGQKKISFELASSLQALGDQVEYIKMEGSGPNALDFHIAYFIGKLAEKNPSSYFHIISKDKGFDPLIKYLKKNKIFSKRVEKLSDIFKPKEIEHVTIDEKANAIAASLKGRTGGRPAKVEGLNNTINAFFRKTLEDSEVQKIVSILKKKKIVKVNAQKVSYQFQ